MGFNDLPDDIEDPANRLPDMAEVFGPREIGHAVYCRRCADNEDLPDNAALLALLSWDEGEGRWLLLVLQRRRLRPGGPRSRFAGGEEAYHGKQTALLRCPVCRHNLGSYSPKGLGARVERGDDLVLP